MAKRLVVCCDGTWNTPGEAKGGVASPTNVTKLSLGVARQGSDGLPQLIHYEAGVGTRRFEHVRGGAFGWGLSRNVRACYQVLVENYEPGDELYFFGFSRGAFTARSTVGLVRNCGILKDRRMGLIDDAYRLYRDDAKHTEPRGIEARIFRRQYSHPDSDIHFIGVWDTVGSLGIPTGALRLPFLTKRWSFHDTDLSSRVRFAYHALAIDERRPPFKPTLWKQQDHSTGQTLVQVWFTGVHSDVGGGYVDPTLAEVSLLWMVERARECGLAFEPDHFVPQSGRIEPELRHLGQQIAPNGLADMENSRKGPYLVLPAYDRPIEGDGVWVASSADRRWREDPKYRPPKLKEYRDRRGPVIPVQEV